MLSPHKWWSWTYGAYKYVSVSITAGSRNYMHSCKCYLALDQFCVRAVRWPSDESVQFLISASFFILLFQPFKTMQCFLTFYYMFKHFKGYHNSSDYYRQWKTDKHTKFCALSLLARTLVPSWKSLRFLDIFIFFISFLFLSVEWAFKFDLY